MYNCRDTILMQPYGNTLAMIPFRGLHAISCPGTLWGNRLQCSGRPSAAVTCYEILGQYVAVLGGTVPPYSYTQRSDIVMLKRAWDNIE